MEEIHLYISFLSGLTIGLFIMHLHKELGIKDIIIRMSDSQLRRAIKILSEVLEYRTKDQR